MIWLGQHAIRRTALLRFPAVARALLSARAENHHLAPSTATQPVRPETFQQTACSPAVCQNEPKTHGPSHKTHTGARPSAV